MTAEEILKKYINGCRCSNMHKHRDLVDPDCVWCENKDSITGAMDEYAAQQKSQKEREAFEAGWREREMFGKEYPISQKHIEQGYDSYKNRINSPSK